MHYVGYVARGYCSRTSAVVFVFKHYTKRESTRGRRGQKVLTRYFVFGVCCAALLSESSINLARFKRKSRSAQQPTIVRTPPPDSWYIRSSTKQRGMTIIAKKKKRRGMTIIAKKKKNVEACHLLDWR